MKSQFPSLAGAVVVTPGLGSGRSWSDTSPRSSPGPGASGPSGLFGTSASPRWFRSSSPKSADPVPGIPALRVKAALEPRLGEGVRPPAKL